MGRTKNGASCVRYTLINFNLLFMISSLILSGLGVAFSFKWSTLIELLPTGYRMQSWVHWMIFFVGLITFFICFLGCWGAFNESYWRLVMYAIMLCGVIIMQVTLCVLVNFGVVILREQNEKMTMPVSLLISRAWPDVFMSPQNAPEEEYSAFYDKLHKSEFKLVLEEQEHLNCCGVLGKSDYSINGKSLSVLPKSCCPAEVEKCIPDEAYDDGCWSMASLYKGALRIFQGLAIGYVCLQVMLVASALYLAKATRQI